MSNNVLSATLLLTTLFVAACLTVFDYRKTRAKLWSTLRGVVYLLFAFVFGVLGPLFSGGLGGLESGSSDASLGEIIGAILVASLEVGIGTLLLRRAGRGG